MGKRVRFRGTGALVVLFVLTAPAGARAQDPPAETTTAEEPTRAGGAGLGPLEFAPEPLGGNLGAPRAAIPQTRLGLGLHWVMGGESTAGGDVSRHALALLALAQLELFETLEVGLEAELVEHNETDYPEPSALHDETSDEFGFLVPRIKAAFLTGDVITLAAGVGVMLPTAGGRSMLPFGIDPGFLFQARPIEMLSINFSLPFVLRFDVPDEGDTLMNFFIDPAVGVAVMPIDYIGGFVDAQIEIWLDPDQGAENFRLFSLLIGVRSNFLPWMMAELGAIVPVAGDLYDDELAEFGLGFRLAATPDLL